MNLDHTYSSDDDHARVTVLNGVSDDERSPTRAEIWNDEGNFWANDTDLPEYDKVVQATVFEQHERFLRHENPGVVVPVSSGVLDNFFLYTLVILHEVPKFVDAFKKLKFDAYKEYKPKWWHHEIVPEKKDFLGEVQRLMCFLESDLSKRSFMSSNNYNLSVPEELVANLYESRNVSESMVEFYESLASGSHNYVFKNSISSFFDSVASHEDQKSELKVFTIDGDRTHPSLYKSLHTMVWDENYENFGLACLTKLSDVLTFCYTDFSNSQFPHDGLKLEEEFYPQIYTDTFMPVIKEMIADEAEITQQIENMRSTQNGLVVFEGKKVSSLIKTSIDYLTELKVHMQGQEDFEAVLGNLKDIESGIKDTKMEVLNGIESRRKELQGTNIGDVENILLKAKQKVDTTGDKALKKILEEPYVLVGVIMNESEFCYRSNSENCWVYVKFEGDPTYNFACEKYDFAQVQEMVEYMTRSTKFDYSDNEVKLMVLYANKASLKSTGEEVPAIMKEFFETDNRSLETMLDNKDDLYYPDSDSSDSHSAKSGSGST